MAERIRVSAVTPTFNRARYLPQCIESVLAQDLPGVEHCIVDDGSTDDTPAVLERYAARHPDRVRWKRQENAGQSAAWNACLAMARGEFVGFLDSDDAWLPGKLSRQIPILEADPAAALLYAAVEYIDADGKPSRVRRSRRGTPSGRILPALLLHNVMDSGSVIARRSALDEAGPFDEQVREGNDWDMWLRIAVCHAVIHDPTPSVLMRRHADQMIADRERMAEGLLRVMEKNLRRIEEGAPEHAPLARRLMARQYLRRAKRLFREGRPEEAGARVARALELDPGARPQAVVLRLQAGFRRALRGGRA